MTLDYRKIAREIADATHKYCSESPTPRRIRIGAILSRAIERDLAGPMREKLEAIYEHSGLICELDIERLAAEALALLPEKGASDGKE